MKVVWEGSFFKWHSLAHVNRELATHLARLKAVDAIAPDDKDRAKAIVYPHGLELKKLVKKFKGPSLLVRHAYPPNLGAHDGPVVLMQPWEFFRAPNEWVEAVRHGIVDELWCNSNFTRNNYILSGVPPQSVRVLPLGFDPSVFHPGESSGADGEFRFLYLGGTIERKGIDVLMRAFLAEFAREDPVRLIVKDTGTRHVYIHMNQKAHIMKVVEDPSAPRVTYVDDDLSPNDLADLIRSCHCVVQPYRGEGFCLPVLEAMACGLAPITTYGGPTDDIVLHSCGWKIASERVQIAPMPEVEGEQSWLEPSQADLQVALREAYENPAKSAEFGRATAELAQHWTWEKVASQYATRLEELKDHPRFKQIASSRRTVKRPTISCCMIVRDEERVIADCLASLKPYVDQIIVVDTGSTDRTPEICREFGVDLRFFEWTDSFAEARNQSMIGATGDWILFVDADDTLPAQCGEAIRGAAASAPRETGYFILPVRFLDGTQVDHVKLFRNLPGLEWDYRIHEQILPSLKALGAGPGRIKGAYVLHSGYDTSPEGQKRKRAREWKLLKMELKERPENAYVLFCAGMTAHYTDDHKKAIPWLKKSIANSAPGDSTVRKCYALWALSLLKLEKVKQARQVIAKGLDACPGDPELMYILGQLEDDEGRLDEALALFQQVLRADVTEHFSSVNIGITGHLSLHHIGQIELRRGNYDGAKQAFIAALKNAPEYLPAAFRLFDAAIERRDLETADTMLAHVQRQQGLSESWLNMLKKRNADTEPTLRKILGDRPDAAVLRMELARMLLHSNREQEAVPHLELLQSQGIAEAAFYLGVLAINEQRPKDALAWMQRAHELDPDHAPTIEHLRALKEEDR